MAKVFKFRPALAQSLEEQQRQWTATRAGGVRAISPRRPVAFWKGVVMLAAVALAVAGIIYALRRGRPVAVPDIPWRDW